jgi:hypothetical protein
VWWQAAGNVIAALIEFHNWYSRYEHGSDAIHQTGLILWAIVVGALRAFPNDHAPPRRHSGRRLASV